MPTSADPVRPDSVLEIRRLASARESGPFVAWRDDDGLLQIEQLRPGSPLTVGRGGQNRVSMNHKLVSRGHVSFDVRVGGLPHELAVYVTDASRHGTQHRRVKHEQGAETAREALMPVPRSPAKPLQFGPGDHDLKLAEEVWIRVGGVPFDVAATADPESDVAAPTPRQLDVLVELCRSQFAQPERRAVPPTNAEIGLRVRPTIKSERVSDLLSELYEKYELRYAKEQNRLELIDFAIRKRLVRGEHYV